MPVGGEDIKLTMPDGMPKVGIDDFEAEWIKYWKKK